jgi:hypothetical protein
MAQSIMQFVGLRKRVALRQRPDPMPNREIQQFRQFSPM